MNKSQFLVWLSVALFGYLVATVHSYTSESLQLRGLRRIRREEEGRNASVTPKPQGTGAHLNSSVKMKSNFKKKGMVLTLDLRPNGGYNLPIINNIKADLKRQETSPLSKITETATNLKGDQGDSNIGAPPTSSLDTTTARAFRILDKLSQLTNIKLKSAAIQNAGTNFGSKNRPTVENIKARLANNKNSGEQSSEEILAFSAGVSSFSDKYNKAPSKGDNFIFNSIPNIAAARPKAERLQGLPETVAQNKSMKVGGYVLQSAESSSSTTERLIPQASSSLRTTELSRGKDGEPNVEHIKEESRVITADQIGGNRPTKVPFHFTTTIVPPSTTPARTPPPRSNSHHQLSDKIVSPHNHVFAPTQDPISVAHNEDINHDDLHDFHAAHSSFGTKVGADVANRPPPSSRPRPNYDSYERPPIDLPVRNLRNKPQITIKSTPSTPPPQPPPLLHPDSASSGINSQRKKTNNINEQLPFYKEQGGVFEHPKHSNGYSEDEPNEIQFSHKVPGVKYAPKGPAAQPQTNVYSSPRQVQHVQPIPQPAPQYVQVQQQPIYLAPVPIQQTYQQAYAPQGVPHYHQPIAAVPVQVPTYYPAPPAPAPQAQVHHTTPHHNYGQQHSGVSGFSPPPQYSPPSHQHQPSHSHQREPTPNNKNIYYVPTSNNKNPYVHEHGRPPPRDDPESDDFYGNPVAIPPKPQSTKAKPTKKKLDREPVYKPERANARDDQDEFRGRDRGDERDFRNREKNDAREFRERGRYEPANPPPPLPPPRRGPDPFRPGRYEGGFTPSGRRGPSEDYDANEHVGDVVRPNGNRGDDDEDREHRHDYDGNVRDRTTFYRPPSSDDYRFNDSPNSSPNFEHPNIYFDNGNRRPPPAPAGHGRPRHGPPPHQGRAPVRNYDSSNDYESDRAPVEETNDRSVPVLDPIYTRTIKQYDDERRRPERPERPEPQREHDDVEPHDDGGDDDGQNRVRYPSNQSPRRQPSRNSQPEEEEEPPHEEEEEESRPPPRGEGEGRRGGGGGGDEEEEEEESQPPPRRENQQEEEPEEEEEEETQQAPARKQPNQEEEEEEEEEEPKKQERGKKKKPPKKPKDEKTGNLDDDIQGIEREFGHLGFGGGPPAAANTNVQYHPVLG